VSPSLSLASSCRLPNTSTTCTAAALPEAAACIKPAWPLLTLVVVSQPALISAAMDSGSPSGLLYQPQDLDLALRPGERDREHLVERGRRRRANPLAGGPGGLAQSEPGSAFPRPDLRHPQSRGVLSDPAMSDIAYPAALLLPSAHPPPPSHVRPYPCRGRALLFLQPRVLLSAWV
jgi:hypothetical protein